MYEPPAALVVQQTEHWLVNHCVDSTLPGYLIVSSRHPEAMRLADVPTEARAELGEILAGLDEALRGCAENDALDGTDMTLYIVREYLERSAAPPEGTPSVEDTVGRLREYLERGGT